jgi:hypothetical protein
MFHLYRVSKFLNGFPMLIHRIFLKIYIVSNLKWNPFDLRANLIMKGLSLNSLYILTSIFQGSFSYEDETPFYDCSHMQKPLQRTNSRYSIPQ